jgi:spermidine synthase
VSGTSPYRLYALSNVGSLAALVSYPFLVEPAMTTEWQSRFWSWGYCLFVLLCGYVAAALLGMGQRAAEVSAEPRREAELSAAPSWRHRLAWLLLPAFASIMLLATTNHVCQDVAVIPFLWVAPLSLYLLTFIVCFDREQWYSRTWFGTGAVLSIIALSLSIRFEWNWALPYELASYFSAMFCVCMVCHGELVRSKPHPRYLTGFYLMSSAGGALGGIAVAVICPQVFSMHLEMNLSVLAGTCLCLGLLLLDARDGWLGDSLPRRCISVLTYLAVLLFVGLVQLDAVKNKSLASVRNFYGVLHVLDNEKLQGTTLVHGRIIHGFQFHNPLLRQMPTTYYSQESGAGVALRRFRAGQPLRVGIVGLGSGTLAAYGRSGDTYRFYEINPAVVDVAHRYFHFLDDCKARVEVALGDARLSLERESPQAYDVLVLDAFSGDAIPTHLLTREAFELYLRHLKPDGVIALHISNRQLRLDPVVLRLAENFDLTCVQVNNRHDNRRSVFAAKWMLLTANRDFLADQDVQRVAAYPIRKPDDRYRLWTDQYSNLFQILNVF